MLQFGSSLWAALRRVILLSWVPCVVVAQAEPWVGEMGVTETSASIMERTSGYQRPPEPPDAPAKKRPRGRRDCQNLLADPASPDTAVFPGNALEPRSTGQSGALSFTGATLDDTQAFPPDSMGAAGPAQYIVAVNGRIRSFDKNTGLPDGVLDVNTDVFFADVMTPPVDQNFTSDPRIRYDRLSGRWFIIMIDVPGMAGSLPNRIMIAVSGSSVITPATPWTFFQFQQDLVQPQSNSDTGKFADYPTLGVDAQALYIGVNIFATRGQGSFASTTGFVVRKSSLLDQGPIVVTAFRKLVGNGLQGGPYTPQGVDNMDPNATEGYFIGVDSAYYGRLQLRRVSDPGGSPTLSGNITITVPLNGNTIDVPHLGNNNGSSGYLDGLDYRLLGAQLRNGHLWTTANLAVDNTGSPSGTDSRMAVRWYELGGIATGETPTVIQSGTLYQPSSGNDANQRCYWMGTIAVSGQGHALLGFSVAGAAEHINAGFAGRLADDPPGTLRAPVLYTSSASDYNPPSDPGGPTGRRWGDYSYTCIDPDDDMTLWTIQEWCQAPNSYAVQVLKVLAPPPATPFAVLPNSLSAGQSNITVTVLGAGSDGAGFFDPGPGFSNRISGAVLGGGVLVNTVAYQNPTNVSFNVTVLPNAAAGSRQISVINPDGQAATSSSGLLAIQPIATNQPPSIALVPDQVVVEQTLLSFQVSATDPEGQALTFSLQTGAPPGAAINATNGQFTWTPSEAQGPSTNAITVQVTDAGTPPQSASRTFTVTVLESNLPPQLAPIADRLVHAGQVVSLTNSASDPDIPANQLSFSLLTGAATGATLDSATGVFTWPTAPADAGTTNQFTVQVADNGSPSLTATQTFTVAVLEPPLLQTITWLSNSVELTWDSIPGQSYVLQYRTNLSEGGWTDLSAPLTATNTVSAGVDAEAGGSERYYRLRLGP